MAKQRFVFRVSAGTQLGIGHLVRCRHLAGELVGRGHNVLFLVDQLDDRFNSWTAEFEIKALYARDDFVDESDDARRCKTWLDNATVVVDDYRLSATWERAVAQRAKAIMVIDDLADREHYCDWLVDQKWLGQVFTEQRYQGLLQKVQCQCLLGPDYSLLAPEYANDISAAKITNDNKKVVILSLGGGGDMAILADIIRQFLPHPAASPLIFRPVIGPASDNADVLEQLAADYNQVIPIRDASSLAEYYSEADLYLGAAGTALYELNCVQLPAITFAFSSSQQNDHRALEDLGHYLHLGAEEFLQTQALVNLVLDLLPCWQRFTQLCSNPAIKVDGKGIARVADRLLLADKAALIHKTASVTVNNPQPSNDRGYEQELKPGVVIAEVVDRDINHYLDSRNLPKNCQNMTDKQVIGRIDHYRWWFNNQRCSYRLTRDQEPMLYIWHQLKCFEGGDYLIGGWFVCSDQCGFYLAALALKWQLAHCAVLHPGVPWVAVIDKQNRFVNLLNQQMGFTEILPEDPAFQATRHFFPQADAANFNFVRLSA